MRKLIIVILTLTIVNVRAQNLVIRTLDKSAITVTLLNDAKKINLLAKFNGVQQNSLRKQWTARTYILSDNRIILEFYDKQAALISGIDDFKKLNEVRFVKNTVDFLKKNISCKIPLTFNQGKQLVAREKPKKLTKYKSDVPEYFDFDVYKVSTGQILFLDKSANAKAACIYPDIKTLSSDNSTIQEEAYGSKDDDYLMKKLANGDRLADYDQDDYLIYPKYIPALIKTHKLALVKQKVYVASFYGNLYKSANGYYILVDEVNQKNGAGNKMRILSLRIYDSLQQVTNAQKRYEQFKERGVTSEHFYKKISDRYGQKFSTAVPQLIDSLPLLLNIDREQLTLDSTGMDIVDEALHWIGTDYTKFNQWFPHVLAYYGECFIKLKHDGEWVNQYDEEDKVWIPVVKLKDGTFAWDWREFYKSLSEGPIPMRWAGDWGEHLKTKK